MSARPVIIGLLATATLLDPKGELGRLYGAQTTPHLFVVKGDGSEIPFEVQAFRKYCLLNGFDDIGLTLRHADKIRVFEAERLARMPWLSHQQP